MSDAADNIEHAEHVETAHTPRKRGLARLVDPLLSSIPSLLGVLVGTMATYFGGMQQNEWKRQDDFRRAQSARVATVAHGYDGLYNAAEQMVGILRTRLPDICHDMKPAAGLEAEFIQLGALHHGVFSGKGKGGGDYEKELAAIAASSTKVAPFAVVLQRFYGRYLDMVRSLDGAHKEFKAGVDHIEAQLIFDVNVYFPDPVRSDVPKAVAAYMTIDADATRAVFPATACSVKPDALSDRLATLHANASQEMIQFARSLEPELGNNSIQH